MLINMFRTVSISSLFLVTLLYICLQDNQVETIKCYVCQSNVDPKCADPFDNLTLPITDCDEYPRQDLVHKSEMDVIEEKGFFATFGLSPPIKPLKASMCRKIRQKVNGEWRTIRGCGYLGPPGETKSSSSEFQSTEGNCLIRHGTYDIFMETCTCNSKDGCNGTAGLRHKFSFLPLVFLVLISSIISMISRV